MDKCSYFIDNKALFGSSPSQETVNYLENIGVKYFVDLTFKNERNLDVYTTKYKRYNYPIRDQHIPSDLLTFAAFIIYIYKIIKSLQDEDKIYIHCKGGHGRAGLVVACIICLYMKVSPEVALILTNKFHKDRHTMRDKWRIIGSPQTYAQKDFVKNFFIPFYIDSKSVFNINSQHSIVIKNFGVFYTAEAAYQAYKNPTNVEYVRLQMEEKNPCESKRLGKLVKIRDDWLNVRVEIMEMILKHKLEQHQELKEQLINTHIKPIILFSNDISFWKNMKYNIFGKLLQKIRNEYLSKYYN